MTPLPGCKNAVRVIEIQAVEQLKAAIEGRASDRGIRGQRRHRSQYRGERCQPD